MEFVLVGDGFSAGQCARYLELLSLIDGYNAVASAATEAWPR